MFDRRPAAGIAEVVPEEIKTNSELGKIALEIVELPVDIPKQISSTLLTVGPFEIEPVYVTDSTNNLGEQLVMPRYGRGYPGIDKHTIICCRGLVQIKSLR